MIKVFFSFSVIVVCLILIVAMSMAAVVMAAVVAKLPVPQRLINTPGLAAVQAVTDLLMSELFGLFTETD